MGIFDALFKPNVARLSRNKNVEGLIKAMKYQKNPVVRWDAAIALGEMKDASVVETTYCRT